MSVGRKVQRLKSAYDDFIITFDEFYDQWDPNTAMLMGKMSELQSGDAILKNKSYLVTLTDFGQLINFSATLPIH